MSNATTRTANRIAHGPLENEASVTSKRLHTNTEITSVDYEAGKSGVDAATETQVFIDFDHSSTHSGNKYCIHWWVDVPASDVLDIRFVTPNTTKFSHMVMYFESEAEFHVSFYKTIAITNPGTSLSIINKNHNSANTSGMTAFDYILNVDLTEANADTNITGATNPYRWIVGSGRDVGGEISVRDEDVLKQNTGYALRFESQDASATRWVQINFCWYEHTDKN